VKLTANWFLVFAEILVNYYEVWLSLALFAWVRSVFAKNYDNLICSFVSEMCLFIFTVMFL